MLTGCTGGNAGINAISSGTLGQANWTLEVELIDGKLLITRVVGPEGFLTVILLVCLPGTEWREVSHEPSESDESSSLRVPGGEAGPKSP